MKLLLVYQGVVEALEINHRAYFLENGQITLERRTHDLLNNNKVREYYWGI